RHPLGLHLLRVVALDVHGEISSEALGAWVDRGLPATCDQDNSRPPATFQSRWGLVGAARHFVHWTAGPVECKSPAHTVEVERAGRSALGGSGHVLRRHATRGEAGWLPLASRSVPRAPMELSATGSRRGRPMTSSVRLAGRRG